MRCPCLDFLLKANQADHRQSVFHKHKAHPRDHSKTPPKRRHHRRSSSESESIVVSKPRKSRINRYTSHFFLVDQFDDRTQLPFAHHLASVATEEVLNFIHLPITIPRHYFPEMTHDVVIRTPTEFFRQMGYRCVRELGEGGFGVVTLVEKVIPGSRGKHHQAPKRIQMACKTMVFPLDPETEEDLKDLVGELYVMKSLQGKCPFIVQYFEHYVLCYSVTKSSTNFVANIFMEFVDGGTLWDDLIADKKPMPLELTHRYFGEIVTGLQFMHRHGIAHNDFKPNNVLLAKNPHTRRKHCRLCDFGMSRFGFQRGVGLVLSERGFGTRSYMPPEALRCRLRFPKEMERWPVKKEKRQQQPPTDDQWHLKYDTFKGDIWALGVSLWLCLTQHYPYDVPENDNIREYIAPLRQLERGLFTRRSLRQEHGFEDEKLIDLLLGLFEPNPEKRFTIHTVAKHAWLQKSK